MSCVPLQLCRFCLVSAAHTSRKQTIQPATQAKQSWIWILDQLYDWLTIAVAITCRLNETQRIWLVKLATSLLWKYFEILWNPRVCKLFKLHRTVLLGITGFPVLHCWNKLLQHKCKLWTKNTLSGIIISFVPELYITQGPLVEYSKGNRFEDEY